MHDKQVRRRRAVLGLLVAASLILLTAYFGRSSSGPLHAVQRGIVEVLSPIQSGASKVLSPVGDVAGWFSSTFRAKSQVARLTTENHQLTQALDTARYAEYQNAQLRALVKLDSGFADLNAYAPVTASVIGRDLSLWYDQIEVNEGTDDGVKQSDPVVGPGGLVGEVSQAGPNYSIVSELNSAKFAAVGLVENGGAGYTGELVPAVGNPPELLLTLLPSSAQISVGQEVVTAGFVDSVKPAIRDLYPPNIPIGQVTDANPNTLINDRQVTVTPAVDLRDMSVVQILTRPDATASHAGSPAS